MFLHAFLGFSNSCHFLTFSLRSFPLKFIAKSWGTSSLSFFLPFPSLVLGDHVCSHYSSRYLGSMSCVSLHELQDCLRGSKGNWHELGGSCSTVQADAPQLRCSYSYLPSQFSISLYSFPDLHFILLRAYNCYELIITVIPFLHT